MPGARAVQTLIAAAVVLVALGAAAADAATTTTTVVPIQVQPGVAPGSPHGDTRQLPAAVHATEPPVELAVALGVELLLEAQEGSDRAEWPYEGVYRVGGAIPIGYRVGGTAICASAVLRAPGYDGDEARRAAVARAAAFVTDAITHPLMAHEYAGGYDVRAWGFCYALDFLLLLERTGRVPDELVPDVAAARAFYLAGLHRLEIPVVGGWSYSRAERLDVASPAAPFMTASCVAVLMDAAAAGHDVDPDVVARGLGVLERARSESGAVAYAVGPGAASPDRVPGAVGRMLAAEVALLRGGRSTPAAVRGAVDAFFVHWSWLEARRSKPGTHAAPYGIAPYYFFFAHLGAAQAIELLPEPDRDEYRRRLRERLFAVRGDDGAWNDRVFPRSASYGTAMAVLALLMPAAGAPARWSAPTPASEASEAREG